ncbi:MFS transporter [Streptomyces sp. NPDC005728]|uniref:MFS transporter n=1 Tax=Streptomyces sp. NPDC005728 TaxID=3157054 RepID=UPI0033D34759
MSALLLMRLLVPLLPSRRRRPHEVRAGPPGLSVHAAVTVRGGTPAELHRCLRSVLAQTYRPSSVVVVDNGSAAFAKAVADGLRVRFAVVGIALELIRLPGPRGRRHALAAGFGRRPHADVYLRVDSRTVLDEQSVAELLRPFASRRVHAVTGVVRVRDRNLLTRLIDLRYTTAAHAEHAAHGRFGAVLASHGAPAAYRGAVVRAHLPDLLERHVPGVPVALGEDRRLAYHCLVRGRSEIQLTAVGHIDLAQRLMAGALRAPRHWAATLHERILLVARLRHLTRAFWWLNLLDLATWCALTTAPLYALLHPALLLPPALYMLTRLRLPVKGTSATRRSPGPERRSPGPEKPGDVPVTEDRWLLVAVAGLLSFMAMLDMNIVNVALPDIAAGLHVSAATAQWAVLGYQVPVVALLLPVGRWLDGAGVRSAVMFATAGFGTCSALAATSPVAQWLIAARLAQGSFAAVLFVMMPLLAIRSVRPQARGRAMSIPATLGPLGAVTGPAVGGLLVDHFGWRAVFLVKLPFCLLALVVAWREMPRDGRLRLPDRGSVADALLVSVGVTALLLALTLASGSSGWLVLVPAAVPPLWWWVRGPGGRPVVEVLRATGLFRAHTSVLALAAGFAAMRYVVALHLQRDDGVSATTTGLTLLERLQPAPRPGVQSP